VIIWENCSHFRSYLPPAPRRYWIGGGIEGLACANLLGRGGMGVFLLEERYVLGE
jgi:hypothetical protein